MHQTDSKTQIRISKKDLINAADEGLLSSEQLEKLWKNLTASNITTRSSRILQWVYYFGGLLTISAMTWFITSVWNWFGGGGIFLVAIGYGIAFFVSGYLLWKKVELRIPGGLLVTAAVCMMPLAIFGLEKCAGIWPSDSLQSTLGMNGNRFFMEIGTITAGLIALKFIPFPFLTAPIAASLLFLSIDLTPLLFGKSEFPWQQDCWVYIAFGLGLLVSSYCIDRRTKSDFAFWGYFFGTVIFWGGLSILIFTSEFSWFFYLCINVVMMLSSILLRRTVLMVFGTFGVLNYLYHLAYQVFADSPLFPFILGLIGIAVICAAIIYQKKGWQKLLQGKKRLRRK